MTCTQLLPKLRYPSGSRLPPGNDVVERNRSSRSNEICVVAEIGTNTFSAVVSVDEEKIDLPTIEEALHLNPSLWAMRVPSYKLKSLRLSGE